MFLLCKESVGSPVRRDRVQYLQCCKDQNQSVAANQESKRTFDFKLGDEPHVKEHSGGGRYWHLAVLQA